MGEGDLIRMLFLIHWRMPPRGIGSSWILVAHLSISCPIFQHSTIYFYMINMASP
jgi:hypothetical protein